MAWTSAPHGARRILAVVPAHNEAASIAATLRSLRAQTLAPDEIVVIADNCSDDTARIAAVLGTTVFRTRDNTDRKAGALNQGLAELLPSLSDADLVLVMDADTELVEDFLRCSVAALAPGVGAVGGVFLGRPGGGLVEQLQRNEYVRYAREINRRGQQAKVLTGTATLFRVDVLREVAERRGAALPGPAGCFYDAGALTEDNEITLALKTLGYRCVSPSGCIVRTELMPTWSDLWRQRKRWQRGAIDNLRSYGWSRVTAPYILRHMLVGLGAIAFALYLAMTALTLVSTHRFAPSPLWSSVGALFVVERVWTARRAGRVGMLLALPLVVELVFDLFLQLVWMASLAAAVRRAETRWHHVSIPMRSAPCTTA